MYVDSCLTLILASRFKNFDDTECSRMGTLSGKRLNQTNKQIHNPNYLHKFLLTSPRGMLYNKLNYGFDASKQVV
jgi:hypothetical protein